MNDSLKQTLKLLPSLPGCYIYYDNFYFKYGDWGLGIALHEYPYKVAITGLIRIFVQCMQRLTFLRKFSL